MIIGKLEPERPNATILTAGKSKPLPTQPSQPQPLDIEPVSVFEGFQGLRRTCEQLEAGIGQLAEDIARNGAHGADGRVLGMFKAFAADTQTLLDGMQPGAARARVAAAAKRDGKALMNEATATLDTAERRNTATQIADVSQGLARRVAADPARLGSARRTITELTDAADLPVAEAEQTLNAADRLLASAAARSVAEKGSLPKDFSRDVQDLDTRLGGRASAKNVLTVFAPDELKQLRVLSRVLRDNGAPDSVIETTVRDVSRRVREQRSIAMEPFTVGAVVLGGVALVGLVAASLEAQKQRSRERNDSPKAPEIFDRLIDSVRLPFKTTIDGEGDEPDTDQSGDNTPTVDPGQSAATASPTEPPSDPENDPLFVLTTRIIAGQIVRKSIEQTQTVTPRINRQSRQLVPQIRTLYPDGIDEEELQRIIPLGTEANKREFRPNEVVTGVLLEREEATTLERAPHVGDDWVDPASGTTYDGVLGNMPPERYMIEGAKNSIDDHVRKSTGKIVVDLHHLGEAQVNEVKDYINTKLPTDAFKRIIILE